MSWPQLRGRRPRRTEFPTSFLIFSVIAGALTLGLPHFSFAYPELVRHGYSNCISCHVSPDGGGVLTHYGRELTGEVLTTWANKDEGNFAFGTTPSWLLPGGDLRTLNIQQETPTHNKVDRLILMQADLEAAVTYKQWTADATIGRLDTAIYPEGSDWISRRFYLMYKPDDNINIRAGRFQSPYGIMMPDHYAFTKRGLNWDIGTETFNLEGSYLTEKYNLIVSGSIGRPDNASLERDSGVDVTGSLMLTDKIKTGFSYHYGTNDIAKRHVIGPWGIIGIASRAFVLAELDFQRNFAYNFVEAQWGAVDYVKADVEPVQGVHVFGTQEFSKLNFSDQNSLLLRYGAGVQWYPRPHYDLEFMWQSEQMLAATSDFLQAYWLMLHFYP